MGSKDNTHQSWLLTTKSRPALSFKAKRNPKWHTPNKYRHHHRLMAHHHRLMAHHQLPTLHRSPSPQFTSNRLLLCTCSLSSHPCDLTSSLSNNLWSRWKKCLLLDGCAVLSVASSAHRLTS